MNYITRGTVCNVMDRPQDYYVISCSYHSFAMGPNLSKDVDTQVIVMDCYNNVFSCASSTLIYVTEINTSAHFAPAFEYLNSCFDSLAENFQKYLQKHVLLQADRSLDMLQTKSHLPLIRGTVCWLKYSSVPVVILNNFNQQGEQCVMDPYYNIFLADRADLTISHHYNRQNDNQFMKEVCQACYNISINSLRCDIDLYEKGLHNTIVPFGNVNETKPKD